MRYPNTRYGNPNEFIHYTQGRSIKEIAKQLKRSERTVRDWITGTKKIPFWVPELLRLQHKERLDRLREMGLMKHRARLQLVPATVHQLRQTTQDDGIQPPAKPANTISTYKLFGGRANRGSSA